MRGVYGWALRADIVAELEAGAYDGLNPRDVARRLRQRFALPVSRCVEGC